MVERSSYLDGEPCWADVSARDAEAARRFYAKVFGWTFDISGPEFGAYAMCMSAGAPVAGMMPWQAAMGDAPASWSLYFATRDVDAAVAATKNSGGRIMVEPMDIPSSGRMAFGFDPSGAAFGFWQAGEHLGFSRTGEPGAFAWAELVTRAPAETDPFYQGLFGYQRRQHGAPEMDYEIWSRDGTEVCGRMAMPPELADDPECQSCWSLYFAVDDTDRAVVRVTEGGGSVAKGPHDSPYGRMARVADPEGAMFHVIDLTRRATE